MIFCTLAGKEQAAHAIVLARSVRRHHPDARMIVCLAEHHLAAGLADDFDEVVYSTNHGLPIDSHASLCAVKARFIHHLLADSVDPIVYLDPFVNIYHPLAELERLLHDHDIIAAPYYLEPCDDDPALEIERLRNGFLHAGFLALRNSPQGRRFAKWWSDRVAESYYSSKRDTQADHKWLSLGMVPFRIHLLKDSAYHAAFRNIRESGRRLALSDSGTYTVGGKALRTFLFDHADEMRGQPADEGSERTNDPLRHLVQAYQAELEAVRQTLSAKLYPKGEERP